MENKCKGYTIIGGDLKIVTPEGEELSYETADDFIIALEELTGMCHVEADGGCPLVEIGWCEGTAEESRERHGERKPPPEPEYDEFHGLLRKVDMPTLEIYQNFYNAVMAAMFHITNSKPQEPVAARLFDEALENLMDIAGMVAAQAYSHTGEHIGVDICYVCLQRGGDCDHQLQRIGGMMAMMERLVIGHEIDELMAKGGE